MATHNHTRDTQVPPLISKQQRFLTVGLYPEHQPRKPWIQLRGLWLLEAGFTPQTRVRVRIMHQCLVITALPPPHTQFWVL